MREGRIVAPSMRQLLEALESREYPTALAGEDPAAFKERLKAYMAAVADQGDAARAGFKNILSIVAIPSGGSFAFEFYDARYTDPDDFAPATWITRSQEPASNLLGIDAIVHVLRGIPAGASYEDVVAAFKPIERLRDAKGQPLIDVREGQRHPLKSLAKQAPAGYGKQKTGGKWNISGLRGQEWSYKYRDPKVRDRD